MKLRLILFFLFIISINKINSQFVISGQTSVADVTVSVCGNRDTLEFGLFNISGSTISNDTVQISIPSGISIESVLSGSGYSVLANGFVITNLPTSQGINVKYVIKANCTALNITSFIPQYISKNPSQTISGLQYFSSLAKPILQIAGTNLDTTNAFQNNQYTRRYTLSNTSTNVKSFIDTIKIQTIFQSGISLVEWRVNGTLITPTMSGDTARYSLSGSLLDSDGKLNGGQSIVITEKVSITQFCTLLNSGKSVFRASWGCNSSCEIKTLNAIVQKGTLAPNIYYSYIGRFGTLQKCSLYDTFEYIYFNRGTSTAYDIIGGSALYGGDVKAIYTDMLAESLISFDRGVTKTNTRISSRIKSNPRTPLNYGHLNPLYSSSQYPPTPDSIIQNNFFTIDSLNPDDTARIYIVLRRLCPSNPSAVCGLNDQWGNNKDYISNFSYYIRECNYKDYCGLSYFQDWVLGGAPSFANTRLNARWQIVEYNQPTDINSGVPFTTSITNLSEWINVESNVRTDASWYYMLELKLDSNIRPVAGATKADFKHIATVGVSHGACDSFSYDSVTGSLKIYFYRNKWESLRLLRAGKISANLIGICKGSNGSIPTSISYRGSYYNNCGTCGLNIASCWYTAPIQLHCAITKSTGGINFYKYDYKRTYKGLADYNNDGYPDGTTTAHSDSINLKKIIPGDTVEMKCFGRVYNISSNQYPYGYAYNSFIKNDKLRDWGDLTHLSSIIILKESSGGTIYTCRLNTIQSTNTSNDTMYFRHNISQDSLSGKGTFPSGFRFKNGDSIQVISYYRFMDNPESTSSYYAIVPFYLNNQLYLTSVQNTNPYKISDTANVESNDVWLGKLEVVFVYSGYRYTSWIYRSVCNSYNETTSTWGEIGGNAPWDYSNFRNEIRPYVTFKNVYKKISNGWELDTTGGVWLNRANGYAGGNFKMILNNHYTYNQATNEVNVNMRKVLDDQYNVGFLFDEARYHNIRFTLKKCKSSIANPILNTPNGVDSLNMSYIYPDIPLTGPASSNSLATGFTIINTGANNTQLVDNNYIVSDYEPKIGIQVIGGLNVVTKSKNAYVDIKLINERYDATFAANASGTWLKITNPISNGLKVDSIQDLSSSTWIKRDSIGVFRTGALSVLQEKTYRVFVNFSDCTFKDSLRLSTSYSCPCSLPSDTGVAQSIASINFVRNPSQISLSTSFTPSDSIRLCDTLNMIVNVNNAGSGRSYKLGLGIQLPNFGLGSTFVSNSFKLYFPKNSTTPINLPFPKNMGGGLYVWDSLYKYVPYWDSLGLADFSDTVNSKFVVKYKLIPTCGFMSSENMGYKVFEDCGLVTNFNNISLPVKLLVEYRTNNIIFAVNNSTVSGIRGCSTTSFNFSTSFTNLGSSVSASSVDDSTQLILPIGLFHISSTPSPSRIDTMADKRIKVVWSASGVNPGNTINFNNVIGIDYNQLNCESNVIIAESTTKAIDTCITDTSICYVSILKDRKTIPVNITRPRWQFDTAYASAIFNPSDTSKENITISYKLRNRGDTANYHHITTYHDVNGNFILDSLDTIVNKTKVNVLTKPDSVYQGLLSLNIKVGSTCPLILKIDSCNCDKTAEYILSNIQIKNAGNDTVVCSKSPLQIGFNSTKQYAYLWNPTIGISDSTIPNPIFNRQNYSVNIDSTYSYIVQTTRSGGACISYDTVLITVRPLPIANAGSDTFRYNCLGDSVKIGSPSIAGYSYSWTPVSGLSNANIAQPFAKPTINTTYYLQVTNTATGCKNYDTVSVNIVQSNLLASARKYVRTCKGGGATISIGGTPSASNGNPPYNYLWSPSGMLNSATTANPTMGTSQGGEFYINLQVTDKKGCIAYDTAHIIIDTLPISAAGRDTSICIFQTVMLGIPPQTKLVYSWNPTTYLSSSIISNPIFSPISSGLFKYFLTVSDSSGSCTLTDTVSIMVNPIYRDTLNRSICQGSSYSFNGNNLSVAGFYYDTLLSAQGCDSFLYLNLLVKDTSSKNIYDTICSNQTKLFNGINRNTTGVYRDTLINSQGCDSFLYLNLFVKPISNYSFNHTICSNQSYTFNGIARTTTGTYFDTLVNAQGCDSFLTLNLTVNPTKSSSFNAAICQGQFYTWNGMNRTTSGAYLDTFATSLGCDSVVTLNLLVKDTSTKTLYDTICKNQTKSFNNQTLNTTGIYRDTLANAQGCDSFLYLNLLVKDTSSKNIYDTICSNQTKLFNGINRSATGVYRDTLINSQGCDSFLYLNLFVKPISNYSFNHTICSNQSYTFNGIARTTTGTYFDTLVNAQGCDSFLTLNLTVNPTKSSSFNAAICQGQFYTWNGMNRMTSGAYLDTFATSLGCDSVVTLNLLVKDTSTKTLYDTICKNQPRNFNGNNLNVSGIYRDTLVNAQGCDSFLYLNLLVKDTSSKNIYDTICSNQSKLFNGINRSATGVYRDTLINSQGCDSFLYLNLFVKSISNYSFNHTICSNQSYTFNGVARTTAGTYFDTLVNAQGCDSFLTLNLTVNPTKSSSFNAAICQGQFYTWNGMNRTTSGAYLDTFATSLGCDSVVTLNLLVKDTSTKTIYDTICKNQTKSFNNQTLNNTGIYKDTLVNSQGCDSFLYLNLVVKDTSSKNIYDTICSNQVKFFNGQNRTTTGIYKDTLTNSQGCDSFLYLRLYVKPTTSSTRTIQVCIDSFYIFKGQNLNTSGTYYDTMVNQFGCDSFITLNLVVNSLPIANAGIDQTRVNCAGDSIMLGSSPVSNYNYTWIPSTGLSNSSIANPWCKATNNTKYILKVLQTNTNCRHQDSVDINIVNNKLTGSKTTKNLTCFNDASGILYIQAQNGYPPYQYKIGTGSWLGTSTISGLNATNYSNYTIEDSKGCQFTDTFKLTEPPKLTLQTLVQENLLCFNDSTGEIEVNIVGGIPPYRYLWNRSNSISPKAMNLAAGSHTVVITDDSSCVISKTYNLTEPDSIRLKSSTITTNPCAGDTLGEIKVEAEGGTEPYIYKWSNAKNTNTIRNLKEGIYTVTIEDKNQCYNSFKLNVIDPLKLELDSVWTSGLNCESKGKINMLAKGGTPTYLYSIDNGSYYSNLSSHSITDEGTYFIKVKDKKGCLATDSIYVKNNSLLKIEILPADRTIRLNESVQLSFRVVEGDSSKIQSILWSPSLGLSCIDCPNPVATPYVSQIYELEVQYSDACFSSNKSNINVISDDELYISNSFSPNALNEKNRTFRVYSNHILKAKLMVFNRWGEKVFESNEGHIQGWDGTYKGELAPQAVYVYYAEITYLDHRIVVKQGDVTLLR